MRSSLRILNLLSSWKARHELSLSIALFGLVIEPVIVLGKIEKTIEGACKTSIEEAEDDASGSDSKIGKEAISTEG